jgi:membrane-associated HD superfamily phosphohydrolase
LLARGIVDTTPRGNYTRIHVVDPVSNEQSARDVDGVVLSYRVQEAVSEEAGSRFRRAEDREAAASILSYLLTPNLSYDDGTTEARRKSAVEAVPSDREYARNERILDSNVRVGRDEVAVLEALEQERRNRAIASDTGIAARLWEVSEDLTGVRYDFSNPTR